MLFDYSCEGSKSVGRIFGNFFFENPKHFAIMSKCTTFSTKCVFPYMKRYLSTLANVVKGSGWNFWTFITFTRVKYDPILERRKIGLLKETEIFGLALSPIVSKVEVLNIFLRDTH